MSSVCTVSSSGRPAEGASAPYAASRTRGSESCVNGALREKANERSSVSPDADATAALSRQYGPESTEVISAGRSPARAADARRDDRYTTEVSAAHNAGNSVASLPNTVPKLC